ncbi:conjugal transfer protein TraT, partial [Pseudomonas amygdali pv. morsprunorum]|nr:conjugal transfer protein TraT [Pseudomonas amygdali pv. morsprunorum]
HGREVEQAWGTTRAGEFAMAFQRLPPHKRSTLRNRLEGCALILPADMFEDLSLLLPTGKTVAGALSSRSWDTYKRSDFYAELDPLG